MTGALDGGTVPHMDVPLSCDLERACCLNLREHTLQSLLRYTVYYIFKDLKEFSADKEAKSHNVEIIFTI